MHRNFLHPHFIAADVAELYVRFDAPLPDDYGTFRRHLDNFSNVFFARRKREVFTVKSRDVRLTPTTGSGIDTAVTI